MTDILEAPTDEELEIALAGPANPQHFIDLVDSMRPYFLNRDEEFRLLMLALVARVHIFLLGKPGTAKSMILDQTVLRVAGARLFSVLLNKFADDSILNGPMSLTKLRDGRRSREWERYLPTADLFKCDEIWKGSGPLNNTMLQMLNERVFFDDGVEMPIPLHTMVSASNELPDVDSGLQAIWDRTGLRREVHEIIDPGDKLRLLRLPKAPANPPKVITMDIIRDAHAQAMKVPVTVAVEEALVAILSKTEAAGVPVISGRRLLEARRIAQAAAWLDGCPQVEPYHLDFLIDYLWERPEQRPDVATAVLSVADPDRADVHVLGDDVAALILDFNLLATLDVNSPEHQGGSLDLLKKLKRAANTAADLEARVSGRAARDVEATWEHIIAMWRRCQRELFDIDEAAIPDVQRKARAGQFVDV